MKILNCLPEYFIEGIENLYINTTNNSGSSYHNIKYIHSDNNSFIFGGVFWDKVDRYVYDIKCINKILINSISVTDIFMLPWREPLPTNNIWEQL